MNDPSYYSFPNTDRSIAENAGILRRLFRLLFIPILFLVIALPKLLGMGTMDISFVFTLFLLAACSLIPLLFIAHTLFRIVTNVQTVDTTTSFIAPASVVWLIPNLFGWIFVRQGEQVGIVGRRVYQHSGFFTYWPLNPERMNTLSIQERTTSVRVDEVITKDETKINLTVKIRYKIHLNSAAKIVLQSTDPYEFFSQSLRAMIESFVRETRFDIFYDPLYVGQLLTSKFQNNFPMYWINVESIIPSGLRVDDKSYNSALEEKIAKAKIEAAIKDIITQPDLRAEIIKKAIDIIGVKAIAEGKDITDIMKVLMNIAGQSNSNNFHPDVLPVPTVHPKASIAPLIKSPLRLLSENPPQYFLSCYDYQILIDTTRFPKTSVNINSPLNQSIFSGEVPFSSLEQVLSYSRRLVEEDLNV